MEIIFGQTVITCLIIGNVLGRPKNVPKTAEVTRYDYDIYGLGNYSFVVDTSDGFHHDAKGHLKDTGKGNKEQIIKGKYSYIGSDGDEVSVDYVADADGFKPTVKLVTNVSKNLPKNLPLNVTSSNETTTTERIEEESMPPLHIGELCLTCSLPNFKQK